MSSAPSAAAHSIGPAGQAPGRRDGYYLFLLAAAMTLNYFDRSIINVLLDPIKSDLHLSDTALGFIAGLGFALLYAILGVPFGRLADVTGRRWVIASGVGLWSLMTAAGGFAQNGMQLALARTGVGIGEAAGTAPSIALVGDIFPEAKRPLALSILNVGAPLGVFLGIIFGGLAGHWLGWRGALMIAGVPGLIVAALIMFTMREPSRHAGSAGGAREKAPPVRATLRFLFRQKTYAYALAGSFFSGFSLNALAVWSAPFYGRVHHLSPVEIGIWVGAMLGLCGALGTFLGGWSVTRFARGDLRWTAFAPALACIAALPFNILMLRAASPLLSFACLGIASFFLMSLLGPIYAAYQAVARDTMRSFALSIHTLAGTIGGLGIGSLLIGMMSDRLAPAHGNTALGLALLAPALCGLPASIFYALAGRHIVADAARARG